MGAKIKKANWDVFKYKFSENPQKNFEWLCYLLFCKEYNKPLGVFRFFNQSAIETNPITIGNDNIGWQAKFYDVSLSTKKDEILSTLKKAKRDYPQINKLQFYTNKEWGQCKGKEPKGLIEAKKQAKCLGIELDWRTSSFFESPFVVIDNVLIAKHFFGEEKSIISFVGKQKKHTESILNEIRTNIPFKGNEIEIERSEILQELQNTEDKIFILSGIGGVGKTAVIKKFYETPKPTFPFYVFKAVEFKVANIDDFFRDTCLQEFIDFHEREERKIVVIDSAEKLLDFSDLTSFKELLSSLISSNWQIVFTSRNNYIDDLNFQFFEIYNIAPKNINISILSKEGLQDIADKFKFDIPNDEKLASLILNPFYLNEYLQHFSEDQINYIEFKNRLWSLNIRKTKPAREESFLKIAFQRANEGQFYIIPECESLILDDELCQDGILGHDSSGYFITHDIYEEWALERIIEREFRNKSTNEGFFESIQDSLPVRRSFRSWVSEKLLLDGAEIKCFIDEVIADDKIKSFWKDEIVISVLRSDCSNIFFDSYKDSLLQNPFDFLRRMTFLLRIACKEIDDSFFSQLGIKRVDLLSLTLCLTKPVGRGWNEIIKFTFNNFDAIGGENLNFILPVIHDWNSKFKTGETTRLASLIALKYYELSIEGKISFASRDKTEEQLIQTILYGSSEIKEEVEEVFQNILKYKWTSHRDPYFELSKTILTKVEGLHVASVFPEYVLKIADLFWTYIPKEDGFFRYASRQEVEEAYGIVHKHDFQYFPASAYQTPLFVLLRHCLKKSIDFIVDFTNKSVKNYVKSGFEGGIEEIEITIDESNSVTQYISNSLWCMYRGTGSPVSPYLLQSIHMALEQYFLEHSKSTDARILEKWLLYLLTNAKSSSITGVVTSIVLKFPDKTFNIAKILFKTKDLFFYDSDRCCLDQNYKSQLLMLKKNFDFNRNNELFDNERIESCDESHRKMSLEHLCLSYQIFKSAGVTEEAMTQQQKEVWEILDYHYAELPDKEEETEHDKTWKLFLCRMDSRKMKISTKKVKNGVAIQFNPEIEPELQEFSDKSLEEINKPMEYLSLRLWAELKLRNDDKFKEYHQYEENPKLALKEVKELVRTLTSKTEHTDEYLLFNRSIPANVCSVLLKFHLDILSKKDIDFCKDIVLQAVHLPLREDYQYQIGDGCQSAISVLPILFDKCPSERDIIKNVLLLNLFFEYLGRCRLR